MLKSACYSLPFSMVSSCTGTLIAKDKEHNSKSGLRSVERNKIIVKLYLNLFLSIGIMKCVLI